MMQDITSLSCTGAAPGGSAEDGADVRLTRAPEVPLAKGLAPEEAVAAERVEGAAVRSLRAVLCSRLERDAM